MATSHYHFSHAHSIQYIQTQKKLLESMWDFEDLREIISELCLHHWPQLVPHLCFSVMRNFSFQQHQHHPHHWWNMSEFGRLVLTASFAAFECCGCYFRQGSFQLGPENVIKIFLFHFLYEVYPVMRIFKYYSNTTEKGKNYPCTII